MKRIVAFIICLTIVLSGCSGKGESRDTSVPASITEQEPSTGKESVSGSKSASKPALELLVEEEEVIDRAVTKRTSKTVMTPDAHFLYPVNATVSNENDKFDADESGNQEIGENVAHKEYTVMVYIVGSNLESHIGAATEDIAEMDEAGIDYDKTNLLLYTGGSRRWLSSIPNDVNCVLDMSKEADIRTVASTKTSADMGMPEALSEFINFCTTYYPADHYGLILWDHGGGPLWGYGNDELFGNDSLLLDEIRTAINSTQFSNGKKLDWVGFDACLMGSIENIVLWKDFAEYLVCSEELEAGKGWDYHFLSVLNESQDTEEIVKSIVDFYGNYYEENKSEFFNPDATLAAIDLSKTDELIESVDILFDAMNKGIVGEGAYAAINQARSRTKAFGLNAVSSAEEGYDLVDLQDFAGQLKEMYPEECAAVDDALKKAVLYSTTNIESAGGISIYVPGNNKALYNVSGELKEGEPLSTQYKSFVDSYTGEWLAESDIDWHLAELEADNGEFTLQLTPDQVANMSQAYYTVLQRWMQYYVPVLSKISIQPDENGVLHIPVDPMLATVTSGTFESEVPWTCYMVDSKDGVNIYGTRNTFISALGEHNDFDAVLDEHVDLIFKNIEGEEQTIIQDVMSVSEGISCDGKGSIDLTNYNTVRDLGLLGSMEKRKENGEILPYNEWLDDNHYSVGENQVPVDSSFQFIMRPASQFDYDYSCQVIIKDVNDGLHATELQPFPPEDERETVEEKTENGVITLELFEDHAEVKSYNGTDSEIEVPETVNGKPVTVIGRSAFINEDNTLESIILPNTIIEIRSGAMQNLRQAVLPEGLKIIGNNSFWGYSSENIDIPDSVEYIGFSAFEGSQLTEVELPASLKKINAMAFHDCHKLKEIKITDSNQTYACIDGTLYTKDRKTLIQYPHGKGSVYTIADGTEVIAYGAFAENEYETEVPLEHVGFPESLKVIENMAFSECIHLQELELPDSVESIGVLAFGNRWVSTGTKEKSTNIGIVHLGPKVIRIGERAFSALRAEGFEVDPSNEIYASANGFLTNKAGDTILEAPMDPGVSLFIPEGITTLPGKVFYDVNNYDINEKKHFYIPDTVFRFSDSAFDYLFEDDSEYFDYSSLPEFTFHCSEGSAAESYAKKYHIPCITASDWEGVLETGTEAEESFSEEKENRDEVTLTWHLYDDHATLAGIETNKNVEFSEDHQYVEIETYDCEIPALYKNLPVTTLGYLDKDIDTYFYANIDHLIIPDSVNEIIPGFLDDLHIVENIEVSEGNIAFMSKDNVLFTADGKTLLYYPRYNERREYTIPAGTEIVGEKAFHSCMYLNKVIFADSVREIQENAFSTCYELETVNFNEGLKIIGDYSFDGAILHDMMLPSTVERIGNSAFSVDNKFGEIILPESLTYLGYSAFNNYPYEELIMQDTLKIPDGLELDPVSFDGVIFNNYEVGEKNPNFSVSEGLLLGKDGKTLVAVPGQRKGEFKIPEGFLIIEYNAFKDSRYLTDVYLPRSIQDIGNLGSYVNLNLDSCPYTIHCYAGTVAQEQLDYYGVEWVEIK